MSPFRSLKIHKIRLHHHTSGWIRGMIAAVAVLVTCEGAAQFSPEINRQLNQAIADGDFHVVSLAVGELESRARSVRDDRKLPFVRDVVSFAAAIFGKCDPSLHSVRIGPEPPFDWRKYGIRPLFNGVSAEAIEDPVAREAYKSALSDHRKLMVRVAAERQKLEEGDYCASAAFRIVESSANQATLRQEVGKHIATIGDAQWIKDRIEKIVLPKPQSIGKPATKANPSAPTQQQQQPRSDEVVPLPTSAQPPTTSKAPSTASEPTIPREQPTSSTPWSIIVILILAALGLLWLVLKRRS
jgi:hypothetical protein